MIPKRGHRFSEKIMLRRGPRKRNQAHHRDGNAPVWRSSARRSV